MTGFLSSRKEGKKMVFQKAIEKTPAKHTDTQFLSSFFGWKELNLNLGYLSEKKLMNKNEK